VVKEALLQGFKPYIHGFLMCGATHISGHGLPALEGSFLLARALTSRADVSCQRGYHRIGAAVGHGKPSAWCGTFHYLYQEFRELSAAGQADLRTTFPIF
jgi:hypothetical protein